VKHISISISMCLVVLVGLTSVAIAQTDISPYQGIDVASADLVSTFGSMVQDLDVVQDRPSFDFGSGAFQNANLTSMVFQADESVSLGGGLTLAVGDYTFAYLVDLRNNPFTQDGSLNDLQLNAMVSDSNNPDPSELIALSKIKGAGYSTNIEFGPHNSGYLQSYPDSAQQQDWGVATYVQYDWPTQHPGDPSKSGYLQPGDMGLVFLFTTPDIQVLEIGEGAGALGATMFGGGSGIEDVENVPVLVPTVPEPSMMLLFSGFVAIFSLSRSDRYGRR